MAIVLPSDCIKLFPPNSFVLLDNVKPSIAIAHDGSVYKLHFAAHREANGKIIEGSAAMRVLYYAANSRYGIEIDLSINPNASATFIEFGGRLWVDGHHNTYDGHKETHNIVVPVPDVVCPCVIF